MELPKYQHENSETDSLLLNGKKSFPWTYSRLAFAGVLAATVAGGVLLLVVFLAPTRPEGRQAFLLLNGNVYTVDASMPRAEAVYVENGKFADVGSAADLRRRHPRVPVVDAKGAFVMPGFTDAHAHLINLGSSMLQVELYGCSSAAEAVARMKAFVDKHGPPEEGHFLLGRGWDQTLWEGRQFPTRFDIDAALPGIPVFMRRVDGHAQWANSFALFNTSVPPLPEEDPVGGEIIRDDRGEPTGVLIDNAMFLVSEHIPPPSHTFLREAVATAIASLHSLGITGVHDAGVSVQDLELFREATDDGAFDLREYAMLGCLPGTCATVPIDQLHRYGDGRVTCRSVKLYLDGALGSWGAAMLEPYSDHPNSTGLIRYPPGEYEDLVERFVSAGWQVNSHGIGDRANRIIVETVGGAVARDEARGGPGTGGRHRMEHAQIVSAQDMDKIAGIGLIPSVQPTHATSDMSYVASRLGADSDRIRGAYAWKTLLEKSSAGLPLGSDFPVEMPNPLFGVYAAVTREDADGNPEGGWFPEQKLTMEETLKGFTLDAAYAAFDEDVLGSISPGKYADFILLDTDLTDVDDNPSAILHTRVLATFFGGELVYGDEAYLPH